MDTKYIIIGIVVLMVIIAIIIISQINSIRYLKNRANRSFSTIDVFLKKRFDLIPNLVEIVKAYSKYEEETVENIVNARKEYNNGNINKGRELNEAYNKLIALVESYPVLKASQNFLELQKELVKVEDEIQASRRLYINDVTNYNTKIQSFPSSILAAIFGYKKMELLSFITEEINIKF